MASVWPERDALADPRGTVAGCAKPCQVDAGQGAPVEAAVTGPVEVLDFWLGEVGPEGWYAGGSDLDSMVRDRFAELWDAAMAGGLTHWVDGTVATLAYIVLTDQMPRNMHRGTSNAFASDGLALAAARAALAAGWDMAAPEPARQFFYMPFEHAENAEDQVLAVRLMTERMASEPALALHARAHQAMIAQFGRFPGRNAALGRQTTPGEAVFLAEDGYGALLRHLAG